MAPDPKHIHEIEQRLAGIREVAAADATYWKELVASGVPEDVATNLTCAWISCRATDDDDNNEGSIP